jgi:hypothetical protein
LADGTDTLLNIERIVATAGNDTLVGGTAADWFSAGAGNDTVDGGDNDDILLSGEGNDTLQGGAGFDLLDAGAMKIKELHKTDLGSLGDYLPMNASDGLLTFPSNPLKEMATERMPTPNIYAGLAFAVIYLLLFYFSSDIFGMVLELFFEMFFQVLIRI